MPRLAKTSNRLDWPKNLQNTTIWIDFFLIHSLKEDSKLSEVYLLRRERSSWMITLFDEEPNGIDKQICAEGRFWSGAKIKIFLGWDLVLKNWVFICDN